MKEGVLAVNLTNFITVGIIAVVFTMAAHLIRRQMMPAPAQLPQG